MSGTAPSIRNYHAHIYFDAGEVEQAQRLAAKAAGVFAIQVGRFHVRPVGPHPRGSCQLTVPTELFGALAGWLALNRAGLTVFAHPETGDDRADHTRYVMWFGESEKLRLSEAGF